MVAIRLVSLCFGAALISACSSPGDKVPFQIYVQRADCVSCKEQENWGFVKKRVYRRDRVLNFASFQPKTSSSKQLEDIGLCYGTALDTINSGATHFRILDKQKWGDWHLAPSPSTVTFDPFGNAAIYEGGATRKNRDQSGMWWTNHYYEVGSPSCENSTETCSQLHKFNLQDCPYEGQELRRMTEEQRGSLACVMKHNPKLLLHKVYSFEAICGFEMNGWISAPDVIKQYSILFAEK